METELYKSRSFSSCIKAAYVLFSTNIKTIFRKTWLPALIYALVLSASVMLYLPDKALNDAGMSKPIITLLAMLAVYILDIAVGTWLIAKIIGLLNGMKFNKNIIRSIIFTGFSLLITIAAALVFYFGKGLMTHILASMKVSATTMLLAPMGTMIIVAVIFGVLFLPYSFSSMKYLIDHNVKVIDMFTKDYRRGWRHWGFIFITLFMVVLILCVLMLIVFTPFVIILLAQTTNQMGMLDGDPSGVPGYFGCLLFSTTLLTMFIYVYIIIWTYFVLYYVYGSVEAIEKEKKEALSMEKAEMTTNIDNNFITK